MQFKNTNIMRKEAFGRLLEIMDRLRVECPWDKKQTVDSLRSLTIEEVYELSDAIEDKNMDEVKKELGDIMMHIVFYSKIASETNSFDISDVINSVCDKLVYRHPHVFSNTEINSVSDVEKNWEKLKLKEKGRDKRVLGGVPRTLPSLIKAQRIQDKARGVGFDWKEKEMVWDKVDEEFGEFKDEMKKGDLEKSEEELGDVLFSIVNAARLYGLNPDDALEKTNKKFIKRFSYIEDKAIENNRTVNELSLEEMDKYWEESKKKK